MGNTLESVKQTHKAILFENFNGWQADTLDLSTVLNGSYHDGTELQDALKRLEVRSFKEFVGKFAPKIYENLSETDDSLKFEYSMDNIKGEPGVPISLANHGYYKMLVQMYEKKKTSGKSNRDFDDSKPRAMITPQNYDKEANRLRKELYHLALQFTEARERHENTNLYAKRLIELQEEVAQKVASSNIGKLELRISNINRQINYLEGKKSEQIFGGDGGTIRQGVLDFDENDNPVIIELPRGGATAGTVAETTLKLKQNESLKQLKAAVEKRIDKASIDKVGAKVNPRTKELILANYIPVPQDEKDSFDLDKKGIEQKCSELVAVRDKYESIYVQAQQAFVKTLKRVAAKMIGVRAFFEHATGSVDGELPEGQGLLVTNCTANELFEDEKTQQNFEKYIIDRGTNQIGNEKIWIGILPHVVVRGSEPADAQEGEPEISPFDVGDIDENASANNEESVVTLSDAKQLLEVMKKGRILTIFSPAVTDEAPFTFGGLQDGKIIEDIKQQFEEEGLNDGHEVFAFPNFTLVGDIKQPVADRENAAEIDIPAVYVDAAYIAAGLVVASQQPKVLAKRMEEIGLQGKIDKQAVSVRVDMEDDRVAAALHTFFNREMGDFKLSKAVTDAVADDHFGFVFHTDPKKVILNPKKSRQMKTIDITNSYVFSARTLSKEDGVYRPIYKTLTDNFVLGYLRTYGPKVKRSYFENLLNNVVPQWKEEGTVGEQNDIVNVLLRKGEDIQKSQENKNSLRVTLSGGDSFIDVSIDDSM